VLVTSRLFFEEAVPESGLVSGRVLVWVPEPAPDLELGREPDSDLGPGQEPEPGLELGPIWHMR
jgi:hypothetical protein